jgi:hypothetical protein
MRPGALRACHIPIKLGDFVEYIRALAQIENDVPAGRRRLANLRGQSQAAWISVDSARLN